MSVAELVHDVHRCWRAAGFADDAFPELAAACLERSAPHRWLTLDGLLDHTFDPDILDARYFNPCPDVLTLYSGPRFCVYAHLWLDTAVELHHHAWNGAFQLVSGSSVHARYRFTAEHIVQCKLRLGQLTCARLELLVAGDTVVVPAGAGWIHGLAYNERPSLAISIRATERPEQIRMEYWRPGLAIEAEAPPEQELLRRKALAFVAGFDRRTARDRLIRWLASADLRLAFHVLRFASALDLGDDGWTTVLDAGRAAHGAPFAVLVQALGDVARIQQLQALRARIHDPDLRLLLAAVCFAAGPADVLALAAARRPGESPRAVVSAWASRLAEDDAIARVVLGTHDPALRELYATFVREADKSAALRSAEAEFELEVPSDGDAAPSPLLHEAYDRLRCNDWLGSLLP